MNVIKGQIHGTTFATTVLFLQELQNWLLPCTLCVSYTDDIVQAYILQQCELYLAFMHNSSDSLTVPYLICG